MHIDQNNCIIWSTSDCIVHLRFWHATHDCIAPCVDVILHRGRFWAKSAASGSVRWWCFRSCWMVLSHVMWGRPSCLLQSAGGEGRILLASALSSMRIICPNKVSRRDWIIAVSLGCFVSLRTSSFRTNWYHLMPSSICKHHWSSASICVFYRHLCVNGLRLSSHSIKRRCDVKMLTAMWCSK